MKQSTTLLVAAFFCAIPALPQIAAAQAPAIPPILVTPDTVDTRIGKLEFKDGAPSVETAAKVYDTLDFTRGVDAFLAFWSFTLYDNQSRSMLDTPQRYPRAGSQSYPSPTAEPSADGSTTIYFGPTQPAGVKRGQLDSDHARQGMVHAASSLQPA